MEDFEKTGYFYLGKSGKDYTLYDSKELTTHAVCVGMTGSGKTGLGIALLEEAAIDKIPAIIIDPKGDLGNLLLTFPNLSAEEFKPWVDSAEADRKGMSVDAYAESVATTWKEGLASWGESAERVKRLKEAVEMVIYTPGSDVGVPLSIINSFKAPATEDEKRDKLLSTTSSLLSLIGISADPIKSREHILISTIIDEAWKKGQDVDIPTLILQVQKPPFSKVGALDVETFYPQKERMNLSISLNNLLASPGFQTWMRGEPLDIQRLYYTKEGKPKLSILSIAHLSDSERMFFVTLLLNEVVSWMRQQPGTSSLRAILYMDEIFGYFPPIASPPSKLPMLTLLKQARAFGLGVVLVTQNPVDLDYKGLANAGTWFIGKLQTERDKMRVIEGLKAASNEEVDATLFDKVASRTFIMRTIYQKEPILFQTRWTLSYLRGPLTLAQIASLTKDRRELLAPTPSPVVTKPQLASAITEYFAHAGGVPAPRYLPRVLGMAKLHFVDTKNGIDVWQPITFVIGLDGDGKTVNWDKGTNILDLKLESEAAPNSTFEELPAALMQEKSYAAFEKAFGLSLYQNQTLTLFRTDTLTSKFGESEGDFRVRVAQSMREKRDKIRAGFEQKIAALQEKMKKAQGKVEDTKQKSWVGKLQAAISFGSTLLGALMSKRGITKDTISKTGTTLRRAGQISKDSDSAKAAEESYQSLEQQLEELKAQMEAQAPEIDPQSITLDKTEVRPRKSDIAVEKVALLWWPLSSH